MKINMIIMFQKPFLELFLIDTTGDTDVHLNDVLVNENHAMFKPELLVANEPQNNGGQLESKESSVLPSPIKSQNQGDIVTVQQVNSSLLTAQ